MNKVMFPYGFEYKCLPDIGSRLSSVLESGIHHYRPEAGESELVRQAMNNPIDSPRLAKLARGKRKIVLIASDHTRPVPSKIIIPLMLEEIRATNPDADITILIATGCHRETTIDELRAKFGEEIVKREKIIVHDCDDAANLVDIGRLP
jgi:nickel-dependent lactate racemase